MFLKRFSSTAVQFKLKDDYAVMAVSILQRNPLIMRPLSPIELEYQKYRQNLEIERARGVFHIPTAKDSDPIKGTTTGDITMTDVPSNQNLNETLGPKDLSRHLHRKLYFCIKDSLNNSNNQWSLPASRFTADPDTSALHLHAHAHLTTVLAPSEGLELYHVGAAPVAFHQENFPDRTAKPFGAKYFFFRSQLIAGRLRVSPSVTDHGWFCREELKSILSEEYLKAIDPILSE